MASDNLNQVGKIIGKTGRDADRALKRAVPIRPRLERIRDVFDSTTAFEMSFEKTQDDNRVLLDLFFNLPPPIRGCKVGCIVTKCEDFDFTSGAHAVTVTNPYLAGTVSVYIDGDKLPAGQVSEANPSGGEVFFQPLTDSYEAVSICYIYITEDCPVDVANECLFDFEPSFAGAELVFCDRFDKAPTTNPFCGLGGWYQGTSIQSPLGATTDGSGHITSWFERAPRSISAANGEATFNSSEFGQMYAFENLQGAGSISETIWVVDLRGWTQNTGAFNTSSFSYTLETPASLNVSLSGPTHTMQLVRPYRWRDISTPGNSWNIQSVTQTFAIPVSPNAMQQYFVMRFLVMPNVISFKMWPLGQDEPDTWVLHTAQFPATQPGGFNKIESEWLNVDFTGGFMGGANKTSAPTALPPGVLALQHWIGRNQIFGYWNQYLTEPLPGYSWHATRPMPQENIDFMNAYPNVYFQAGDYGPAPTLTQFQNNGWGTPTHVYSFVTGFFGGGGAPDFTQKNLFSGSDHYAVSANILNGKPTTVRITGQVRWNQPSASRGLIPHMTIMLQAMSYGEQTPNVADGIIFGEVKQTIQIPRDDTTTVELPGASGIYSGWRANGKWTDFQIEIPSNGNHVQWGARFLDDPMQVQEWLDVVAVDSILRSTNVNIQFRGLYIDAIMNPISANADICAVGPLTGRCTQISESFPTSYSRDNTCATSNPNGVRLDTYQGDNLWTVSAIPGVVIPTISNNKVRVDFRARGQTTNGDDGRCMYTDFILNNALGTTRTTSSFGMFLGNNSPAVCGWFEFSGKVKFRLPSSWTASSGSLNFTQPTQSNIYFAPTTGTEFNGNAGTAVPPYPNIYHSQNSIPPDFITFQVDGPTGGRAFPWTNDTQYNIFGRFADQLYIKVWQVGAVEPSTWTAITAREGLIQQGGFGQQNWAANTVAQGFGLFVLIENYSDDANYVEFSDISVTSLEHGF